MTYDWLPPRRKNPRNFHQCERCGCTYYRRTGNNPNRVTRYCSNECKFRREVVKPPAPVAIVPLGYVAPRQAGEIVGYSASQVRRLAGQQRIASLGGGKGGRLMHVSLQSLRAYIAAAG